MYLDKNLLFEVSSIIILMTPFGLCYFDQSLFNSCFSCEDVLHTLIVYLRFMRSRSDVSITFITFSIGQVQGFDYGC